MLMLVMMLSTVAILSSCGGDDDNTPTNPSGDDSGSTTGGGTTGGGTTGGTTNAADVAIYAFTDAAADYVSLELTEDSRYIIERNVSVSKTPQQGADPNATCFAPALRKNLSRASYYESKIVEGKCTKSNGKYILEGFGTATIVVVDRIATVTITENGKREQVLKATMTIPTGKESDLTNKLCHTWKITKLVFKYTDASFSFTPEEYAKENEGFAPAYVTISKVGTYLVTDIQGVSEMAHWRWDNEAEGIMQYSWDYDAAGTNWNSREAGFATVAFEGETIVVTEDFVDEHYTSIAYCTRVK